MVAIVCPMLAALLSAMAADAPIVLDPRKQLFLDDYLIASMTRVRRTVEQARKFSGNPVLWPTEHWEPPMAIVYGSVIRDGARPQPSWMAPLPDLITRDAACEVEAPASLRPRPARTTAALRGASPWNCAAQTPTSGGDAFASRCPIHQSRRARAIWFYARSFVAGCCSFGR
jgi:hypothetical protein